MNEYSDKGTVLLWDTDAPPPLVNSRVALWRAFDTGGVQKVISIPQYVEDNADRFRAKYLEWVYQIGESKLNNKRLIERLRLSKGLSYWWLTLIAEKCNYSKSAHINDAIRLMAFVEWASANRIYNVEIVTANTRLSDCVRLWCMKSGIGFRRRDRRAVFELPKFAIKIYKSLLQLLQALLWLGKHLITHWALKGVGLKEWKETNARTSFFSYLFNLTPESIRFGYFESRYWANLPDKLRIKGHKTNWLHLYIPSNSLSTAKKAASLIRRFNTNGNETQTHVTVHTFLSVKTIFLTVCEWGKLVYLHYTLTPKILKSQDTVPLNIWPLFEEDWRQSLFGRESMRGLLTFNMVCAAVDALPKQKIGAYLQENQAWEFGLIHAWQRAKHGDLIGVPHTTVRFWDLRYFFDPRSYARVNQTDLPLPNAVAVNGSNMLAAYVAGGYPISQLVGVEALRYLHLYAAVNTGNALIISVPRVSNQKIRLLVLGDDRDANNKRQLKLLMLAAESLQNISVTVKPHPACEINADDYLEIKMIVTNTSLADLLPDFDVVFASPMTSAAVDAYCSGVAVISFLDPQTMNLSPLRGYADVVFVSNVTDLVRALNNASTKHQKNPSDIPFFTLDSQLPRWDKLLSLGFTKIKQNTLQ